MRSGRIGQMGAPEMARRRSQCQWVAIAGMCLIVGGAVAWGLKQHHWAPKLTTSVGAGALLVALCCRHHFRHRPLSERPGGQRLGDRPRTHSDRPAVQPAPSNGSSEQALALGPPLPPMRPPAPAPAPAPRFQFKEYSWYSDLFCGRVDDAQAEAVRATIRDESARIDGSDWRLLAGLVIQDPKLGVPAYAEMARLRFAEPTHRVLQGGREARQTLWELYTAYQFTASSHDPKRERLLATHMCTLYEAAGQGDRLRARLEFARDWMNGSDSGLMGNRDFIHQAIWRQLQGNWNPEQLSNRGIDFRQELALLNVMFQDPLLKGSRWKTHFQTLASQFAFEWAVRLNDPELSQLAAELVTQWTQGWPAICLWRINSEVEWRCSNLDNIVSRAAPFRSWYEALPDNPNDPMFIPKNKLQSWFPQVK
jgi:hypothetical protein